MFVHLADCWVRATHAELPSPPSHPSPPPPSSSSPPFHSFPPPSSPPSPNLYSSSHHPTSVSPPSSPSPASFTPSPLFSFHTLPPSIPSPLYSPSSSSPSPYLSLTFHAAKHWHGCVFAIQLHFMAALFLGSHLKMLIQVFHCSAFHAPPLSYSRLYLRLRAGIWCNFPFNPPPPV